MNNITCTRVSEKVEEKFHHPSGQELAARRNRLSSVSKSLQVFFSHYYSVIFITDVVLATVPQCWLN